MKFVNLEQGSTPWLAWRRQRITATMPAVIMGHSSFSTPNQLWRQIVLGEQQELYKPAVERGKDLEPVARAWAENNLGITCAPLCIESSINPRHAASLDGYDPVEEIITEIKCPGVKTHEAIKAGNIPLMYLIQVQWQLYVSEAKYAYIVSFGGLGGVYHRIDRDDALLKSMLEAVTVFEGYIDELVEPPLCDRDWAIEESADWLEIADMKKQSSERLKQAEYEDKVINAKLEQLAANRVRIKGGGISYSQSISRGKVKYSEVLKELGVEASFLDKYRGSPIVKTTIRVN